MRERSLFRMRGIYLRVLAIDPGQRTGVALLEVLDNTAPILLAYEEIRGGVLGFEQWWTTHPDYDVLVCEDYIPRAGVPQRNSSDPQRIIGFLRPFTPVLQSPSGRKKAVSDAVLKRLGLYLPGEPLRNAREAVRHAVWWVKQSRHMPTLRVGWG